MSRTCDVMLTVQTDEPLPLSCSAPPPLLLCPSPSPALPLPLSCSAPPPAVSGSVHSAYSLSPSESLETFLYPGLIEEIVEVLELPDQHLMVGRSTPHHTPHHSTPHHTYTALHYTTLHYTTLHYTTLHHTTLHYTTQHNTTPPF